MLWLCLGRVRLNMGRTPVWALRSKCPTQLLPARAEVSRGRLRDWLPVPQPHCIPAASCSTSLSPERTWSHWQEYVLTQGPRLPPLSLHSLVLLSHSVHQAQETRQGVLIIHFWELSSFPPAEFRLLLFLGARPLTVLS